MYLDADTKYLTVSIDIDTRYFCNTLRIWIICMHNIFRTNMFELYMQTYVKFITYLVKVSDSIKLQSAE